MCLQQLKKRVRYRGMTEGHADATVVHTGVSELLAQAFAGQPREDQRQRIADGYCQRYGSRTQQHEVQQRATLVQDER